MSPGGFPGKGGNSPLFLSSPMQKHNGGNGTGKGAGRGKGWMGQGDSGWESGILPGLGVWDPSRDPCPWWEPGILPMAGGGDPSRDGNLGSFHAGNLGLFHAGNLGSFLGWESGIVPWWEFRIIPWQEERILPMLGIWDHSCGGNLGSFHAGNLGSIPGPFPTAGTSHGGILGYSRGAAPGLDPKGGSRGWNNTRSQFPEIPIPTRSRLLKFPGRICPVRVPRSRCSFPVFPPFIPGIPAVHSRYSHCSFPVFPPFIPGIPAVHSQRFPLPSPCCHSRLFMLPRDSDGIKPLQDTRAVFPLFLLHPGGSQRKSWDLRFLRSSWIPGSGSSSFPAQQSQERIFREKGSSFPG
ncbi:uncharacterized protein LOC107209517 [Parus major]|uniref:uncharacterized protein LOC107209517 n=1 Tax=Parus major TaxID=9157 RepID=UPI000771166F|nr:uncharacterized protein LOC107209517 [Parus major]